MRLLVVATLAIVAVAACKGETSKGPDDEGKAGAATPLPVDIADPAACTSCHAAIVGEWQQSMHARAHHSRDPIYAGVRALRAKKEGADITRACAGCHTPGFEDDPEAKAAAVGVGCATCHNARVGGAPHQLLGPNDVAADATDAHGTGPANAMLADGTTMCMTCHASLDSPSGLSMCATGAEHEAIATDERASCASCHMPRVAGAATTGSNKPDHASHGFLGPHRAWYQDDPAFAATAVNIAATLSAKTLAITVSNVSGHSFPTGFPGRMAVIGCVGRDASGEEKWRCEPRVLTKKYIDAEGKPTLAPFAETLASDTRIAPGASEVIEAEVPKEVASVEVTVSMRLVPEMLAAKLGLTEAPEAEPRVIHTVTVAR